MNLTSKASEIFKSTLAYVNPTEFLPDVLKWNPEKRVLQVYDAAFNTGSNQNIYAIGTGKASPTMAAACENILGSDLSGGLIIAPPGSKKITENITMLEGSHPLPDEKSHHASKLLLKFISTIPDGSMVIHLVSGGTSSLFCLPADGISIQDLRNVYRLLLESGASIHEVNTVRKTLSKIKGGQMLGHLTHTTLLDLVISDVPDDDLRHIGSGPGTAQEISYTGAKKIAETYEIWEQLPESVRSHILEKIKTDGAINTRDFDTHHSWIVSSAANVAQRTAELLQKDGFSTTLIHPAWTGLIGDYENHIFEKIESDLLPSDVPTALVFYGECTVQVTGSGLGGRNQELALRMARRLKDIQKNITFLSAGTDGIDGPTEVAGAVVDQNTWADALDKGMNPQTYITSNDSYHFFKETGGHIKTGPTGNNVMDIQIVLLS